MPRPDATHVSRWAFPSRLTAGACAAGVLIDGGFVEAAPKTYTNPVYKGSMPDPFVLRHRGYIPQPVPKR